MSQNICNICGANYEYIGGRWKCRGCGAYKIEELSNEEATLLYSAAQKLRFCDFDEAEKSYNDIIEKFPKNSEGYWGRLISKYGIKYEEDFDGRKIPTCYATSIESIIADKDYRTALSLADKDARDYYEKQARYMESVRKEWIERASKEKPYDVFICYKESDFANGIDRTKDSISAQDLYIHLTEQGYRVFFSRVTLRDKVGEKFEPYIFNALVTCKAMIVYGTSAEYITSTWLKNEWHRYYKKMMSGEKASNSLIVAYDGLQISELPNVLSSRQCFNANDRSFYTDLDKHLLTVINRNKNEKTVKKEPSFSLMHEHKYTTVTVDSSCISKGYILHKCDCGYEYKDNFKPLTDHNFELSKTFKPTCNTEGKKEFVCSVCAEKKYETLPKLIHKFGDWVEKIHPACTTKGERVKQCLLCGHIETEAVRPIGHRFSAWKTDEKGIETRHCLNCGKVEIDKRAFDKSEERKEKNKKRLYDKSIRMARRFERKGEIEKATHIYSTLSDDGDAYASWKMYEYSCQQNFSDKLKELYLTRAADAGMTNAQFLLGIQYMYFAPLNYSKARSLFTKAAQNDHIMSHVQLGLIYSSGLGCQKDYDKAREHFEIAVERGNSAAAYHLGLLWDTVTEDHHTNVNLALKYYLIAEKNGIKNAVLFNNIAMIYTAQKKYGAAQKYFNKAKANISTDDEELAGLLQENMLDMQQEKSNNSNMYIFVIVIVWVLIMLTQCSV